MRTLILGVGSAQYDAIRWCRDAGHEVHGCGLARTGLGAGDLDAFLEADIRDAEAVTQYCRSQRIELVYSVGSDVAMPTVGEVSERLGLRHFVTAEVARTCQDKGRMRSTLGAESRWNLPCLIAAQADELDAWTRFPCIIKPVDCQGQRGVFACDDRAGLAARFAQAVAFSRTSRVIVEELVEGQELSVNVHLADGDVVFLQASDRYVYDDLPGGIVREHRVPSHATAQAEVETMVRDTTAALGLTDGPAYFQAKAGPGGLKLLEVTPRLDGCHLWRLIRFSTGTDLLDSAFRHLVEGGTPRFEGPPVPKPGVLRFMSEKPGRRMDRSAFRPGRHDYLQWYYEQDEEVRPINGLYEKVGYTIEMEA